MSDEDFIKNQPPWTGTTFVSKTNHTTPQKHEPRHQTLPDPFVVIITGASRGIGKATAVAFAQAGATGMILTARKVESLQDTKQACEKEAKHSNIKITALAADNAAESSAVDIANVVKKEYGGRLDLLINNAGILGTDETAYENKIAEISSSQIEGPINVNYLGRFYMIKHLMPLILAGGDTKAIVNISSLGSHLSGPLGFSISALATNRLSQRVHEGYAADGVVCFAVHPGAVYPDDPPPGMPSAFKEFSKDSPSLCGGFLVWLVKEKRNWLSGRYLDATWDVDELEKKRHEIVTGDKLKMRLVV